MAAGVTLVAVVVVGAATLAVLAFRPDTTPAAARLLYDANGLLIAFASFPAAAFLASASVVLLRSRVLPSWLGWAGELLGEPAADHPVQPVSVDRVQRAADRRLVRCDVAAPGRVVAAAQPGQRILAEFGGELADRGEAACAGQHRATGDRENRRDPMPHPSAFAWVRQLSEPVQQPTLSLDRDPV
ncbi:MAG TPA: hypothetical protein VFX88_15265 [Actinomycetota bacterium]|nr:hypothetical protein [Actinomycetota bacterium]